MSRRQPMPFSITTLGGSTILAACSRCQSQRNYEFATDSQVSGRQCLSKVIVFGERSLRRALPQSTNISGCRADNP